MDLLCFFLFFSFFIGAVAACIYTIVTGGKKRKAIKKQQQQDKANGIKRFSSLEHAEGLDVAEKSTCSVMISPSSLVISCTGKEYTLPLKRITYVDFFTDTDKIRYLESSTAKGIMGAALFGVSGAVVGAAPKTKVAHEKTGYAVIEYRDAGGREKRIILRDQAANSYMCSLLISTLNSCIHATVEKVEL